jgi:hypothetical protein
MERIAFHALDVLIRALGRLRDIPFRLTHPGRFRIFWQPAWMTSWRRRLARPDRRS